MTSAPKYHALLMPCLYGPEVNLLQQRGVPAQNLYALEREPKTLKIMRRSAYLRDVWLPPAALPSCRGIDHVAAALAERGAKLSLAYLDFFGSPGLEHVELFWKMFRLKVFAERARLLVTFGVEMRGRRLAREVNKTLAKESDELLPVRAYLKAVMPENAGIKSMRFYPYKSRTGRVDRWYVTTDVQLL